MGSRVSFPTSSNISLSKEEKHTVVLHHDAFKIFKVVLQMATMAANTYPKVADALKDIGITALTGMHSQLRTRDQAWIRKALPVDALPTWHGLKSSTLDPADQDWFFMAMKYAAYHQQSQKPWWSDKQKQSLQLSNRPATPGKGKWQKPTNPSSTPSSGLGVGASALRP